jgi:hypothetical protein
MAPKWIVHPKRAEVEPAVVRIAVRSTEYTTALAKPDCDRDLGAVRPESTLLVETLKSIFKDLKVFRRWIGGHLDFWSIHVAILPLIRRSGASIAMRV